MVGGLVNLVFKVLLYVVLSRSVNGFPVNRHGECVRHKSPADYDIMSFRVNGDYTLKMSVHTIRDVLLRETVNLTV